MEKNERVMWNNIRAQLSKEGVFIILHEGFLSQTLI